MKLDFRGIAALALLSLLVFSCKDADPAIPSNESIGEQAYYGDGTIRAYGLTDDNGALIECGVIFEEKALQNLPKTPPVNLEQYFTASMNFPAVVTEQTGFQHMTCDYYPYGHNPMGIFDVEQIDFYFHYASEAERLKIGANAADSTRYKMDLPAGTLPPTFIDAVYWPTIGTHLVNVASPTFAVPPFQTEQLYGKYDGKLSFIEPMISLGLIRSVTSGSKSYDIFQPGIYPKPGKLYPKKYNVSRDASGNYRFSLSDFEKH